MANPTTKRAINSAIPGSSGTPPSDHGRKDLDAHGFPQTALVKKRLGENAEAGERQDPGESQGLGEVQAQAKIKEVVSRHCKGYEQRQGHGQDCGNEEPPANGLQEPGDVKLFKANEEEEHKDADSEDKLDFLARLDEAGHGAENDAGHGVGKNGVQAKALEYSFKQLGDDDERTNRKESVMEFHAVVASPSSSPGASLVSSQ